MQVGTLVDAVSGERWEAADVGREVARRARRFARLGLARGDRVFLHFGNRVEFFAELLAGGRLGAGAIPLDARLTAYEVETLAAAAAPRFAVVDESTDAAVAAASVASGAALVQTAELASRDASGDVPHAV